MLDSSTRTGLTVLLPVVVLVMTSCVTTTREPGFGSGEALPGIPSGPIPIESQAPTQVQPAAPAGCPLPLTDPPGQKLRLAYVQEGSLWLLDEGSDPLPLVQTGDVEWVDISEEGELILFSRQVAEGAYELWAVDLQGELQRLSEVGPGPIRNLLLSGDRQLVAFIRHLEKGSELWVASMEGTGARLLIDLDDLSAIEVPFGPVGSAHLDYVTWLPGTHRLAYVPLVFGSGNGDAAEYVYEPVPVVDADTGQRITFLPSWMGGYLKPSPDGLRLALVSPTRISLLESGGSPIGPARIEFIGSYYYYDSGLSAPRLAWDAESRYLLAAVPSDSADPVAYNDGLPVPTTIWKLAVDASPPEPAAEFTGKWFLFSPDLRWVAHLGIGTDGVRGFMLSSLTEAGSIQLGFGEEVEIRGWAPDSRHLAYGRSGGRNMAVDICGAKFPLTDMPDAEFAGWVDGSRFLLFVGPTGDWDLYMGTLGGPSVRLVEFGASVIYDFVVVER